MSTTFNRCINYSFGTAINTTKIENESTVRRGSLRQPYSIFY